MSEKNIQTVQSIYAAFGRGDVPGVMEHLAEDLRHFGVISTFTDVPWYVQSTKKSEVPRFFQALANEANFTKFDPTAFASNGEHVYCTVSYEATLKRNGKKLVATTMHKFTFKNGRVVEWQGTEDTANTRSVLLG